MERSGFRTREDAQAALNEVIALFKAGVSADDSNLTVGQWLDMWLTELRDRGRSPKTLVGYKNQVEQVWMPALGKLKLRDLNRSHIERVLTEIGKPDAGRQIVGWGGRAVEVRSAATIDSYRRTLRAALSAAVRKGLIPRNPATGRMDSIPDMQTKDLAIWEPGQTAAFLKHIEDDRLAALYKLAAYTGMRRGELFGLRWADIRDGGINIRQTLIEVQSKLLTPEQRVCKICGLEHVGLVFKGPKSQAGRRWVPLAKPAHDALIAHKEMQDADKTDFGDQYSDHDLVFCSMTGLPIPPSIITKDFVRLSQACGLPRIRLHDLRHGACSLLLSGGVPIEVVQMILGHSSPSVTRKVYAHLMRDQAREQVEAASALLGA